MKKTPRPCSRDVPAARAPQTPLETSLNSLKPPVLTNSSPLSTTGAGALAFFALSELFHAKDGRWLCPQLPLLLPGAQTHPKPPQTTPNLTWYCLRTPLTISVDCLSTLSVTAWATA